MTMVRATGRGRPVRLPEHHAPFGEIGGGARQRTAWLLAVNRMHHLPGPTSRRELLARLTAAGIPANPSRLSRWESGTAPVTTQLLAAYEEALGLPPHLLHFTVEGVYGGRGRSGRSEPSASPKRLHARIDRLLDGVTTAEIDAAGWHELSVHLTRNTVYMPPDIWRAMTGQLVSELARSVGRARLGRLLAARTLLSDRIAGPPAVRSLAVFPAHRSAPSHPGRF